MTLLTLIRKTEKTFSFRGAQESLIPDEDKNCLLSTKKVKKKSS